MRQSAEAVIRTAFVYAVYVFGSVSLALSFSGPWYLVGLVLATVGEMALLLVGSVRLARQTGERDVILPALAAVLGRSAATLLLATSWPQMRSIEFASMALPQALTLGFVVRLDQAVSPIPILIVGGQRFGLGIPWALLIIYTAVFWNRRRTRSSGSTEALDRQA